MIEKQVITMYRLSDLPSVCHFPSGQDLYDSLSYDHKIGELEYKISNMISRLEYSIDKYDYPDYEPENIPMVNDLKNAKKYLETCLAELQKIEREL